ncbi:MAG: hypothetical protein GYB67_01110 [Chloroflexi bacterium]|nr:hypothetical protein [Chloroflexota bacterium]
MMDELPPLQLVVYLIVYGFALWFGLYLLARNGSKPGMRFAGLGLVAYALGLAADLIIAASLTDVSLDAWRFLVALLPSLFWFGAVVNLVPQPPENERQVFTMAFMLIIGLAAVLVVLEPWWLAVIPPLTAVIVLWVAWRRVRAGGLPQRPVVALITATLFFALSGGLLAIPALPLPLEWVLIAIGFDLLLLGYAIASLDAYDEGEALWPDFLRSLGTTALVTVLIAGQAGVWGALGGSLTLAWLGLLLTLITTTVALMTLAAPLRSLIDRLVFAQQPQVQSEREQLQAVASALPRRDETLDILALDAAEFARLTRRALSHLRDVSRLAASPLTQLPIIDVRLRDRASADSTLERAAELRVLLIESIDRLKPLEQANFGTTDAWRHYNALYFPYVIGLRPFSQRIDHDGLDADARAALEWFRTYVPERTLYNWQTAAAKLIAQDLRDQIAERPLLNEYVRRQQPQAQRRIS